MQIIKEGKATIRIKKSDKVSKDMPVFYNPDMKLNRDVSVLLLNTIEKKDMQIADPLAASGIRSIRFLLELDKSKIKNISINDNDKKFKKTIKDAFKLNKIKKNKKIILSNEDANKFLFDSTGFNYVDLDPWGSPNPFLDVALRRISRDGILAVTATDTAPLCGTYEDACLRKYWAKPLRNELMHEIGLRILIRKVQLIGTQYDKALVPIFSYYNLHYFRIFFRCDKGKKKCDEIIKLHGFFDKAGPMWIGDLWDIKLAEKMAKNAKENQKFLNIIKEESKIKTIGFYELHKFCERSKLNIPRKNELIEKLKKENYQASETHFSPLGIRSDVQEKKLIELIQQI